MEEERAKKGWKKTQGFQNWSSISVIEQKDASGWEDWNKPMSTQSVYFTKRTEAAKEDGPVKISAVNIRHEILVLA